MPAQTARKNDLRENDWMSVPQAARALGCAYVTVLNRAAKGELEATQIAGRTFISRASVDRVLQSA